VLDAGGVPQPDLRARRPHRLHARARHVEGRQPAALPARHPPLSDEQLAGIESIHRESRRDLEDLLVNGRYLEAEELGGDLERQILDDLMRYTRWANGNYEFDSERRWPNPPLVRLSIEGALIEVARRADEHKRYMEAFPDMGAVLTVRDFPDPTSL
jgi:hypothetical protein